MRKLCEQGSCMVVDLPESPTERNNDGLMGMIIWSALFKLACHYYREMGLQKALISFYF